MLKKLKTQIKNCLRFKALCFMLIFVIILIIFIIFIINFEKISFHLDYLFMNILKESIIQI